MRYNFSTAGHRVTRFQQNVQKQTGNTKKNSVQLLQLTILCWAAGKCTTEKRQYPNTGDFFKTKSWQKEKFTAN